MAFTATPLFIFDVAFAGVHVLLNVVLLFLLLVLRNNKIIKVRSFTLPFACFAQIFASVAPAIGHFDENARCFLLFFVSSPFGIGSLVAFSSAYFKNMLLRRLQLLRREYMARKNGTSTDNTVSSIDYSTTSEKEEGDSDEEVEMEDKLGEQPTNVQLPDQVDSKTANTNQASSALQEKLKQKIAARNARRARIAKHIAVVKKLAADWMVLIQIVAVFLVLEAVHFVVLLINRAGTTGPFAGRCLANAQAIAITDLIALAILIVVLGSMILTNLILSYKELHQCKVKEVLYDNDPFLFISLTGVCIGFLAVFIVVLVALSLKLGMQNNWSQIAKTLLINIPITWIGIVTPIAVALYRHIHVARIARRTAAKPMVDIPSVPPSVPTPTSPTDEVQTSADTQETQASRNLKRASIRATKVKVQQEFKTDLFKDFNPEPGVIEYLMEHKTLSVMFKSFAEKEYSDENVYFYVAVKKMRAAGSKKKKISRRRVQELYDNFLTSSSPMEVNVPARVREACKEVLKGTSKKLETPVAFISLCLDASITNLGDIYRRFYASSQFRNFLKQIGSS